MGSLRKDPECLRNTRGKRREAPDRGGFMSEASRESEGGIRPGTCSLYA